ncbi:MAG: RnfABCDGE type electron transport complex subunit D [Clostridiales bacterium]|nr:RnfABCDGE type electron transport complex subunit D [Clostridiales bacterium]
MEQARDNKLIVSVSPHINSGRTTRGIMLDVIIALLPALVAGSVIFGLRSLLVAAVSVATCLAGETLFNLITKRKHTVGDLSAVVTGLILGLNLPADIGIYPVVIGSLFAIVVIKCLFGGLGKNFANPAAAARVMMLLAFSNAMGSTGDIKVVDAVASPTPLAVMKGMAEGELPKLTDMLLGLRGGAIGETCAIALIIGFAYLLIRRVVTWHTTVVYVGCVFLLSWLIYGTAELALYQILSGGLLLGAIFMATDYVTTPTTNLGKVVFGLGCAIMTVLIRKLGAYPEGVSFSILFMNLFTNYIDKLSRRKPLGEVKA